MFTLTLKTNNHQELKDITRQVEKLIAAENLQDGLLIIFNPHTTAGLTINEGADPAVIRDILVNLARLIPQQGDYQHIEGNSDAHIKSSLMGSSVQVMVEKGRLLLGTWQKIFFAEFDGPRPRNLWLKWLRSS